MIEELCLSGGIHRGIAELGALKALEECKLLNRSNLKRAVGVSIGALVLCVYIIGYTIEDTMDVIIETNISLFNDISFESSNSVLRGHVLRLWISQILSKKINEDMTTLQFYEKYGVEFITSVVSLDLGLEYISHKNYPEMKLFDQITSTMALPLIFPPVKHASKVFLDGGILDNFPMHLLSKSNRSFGILIKSSRIEENVNNNSIFLYIKQIFDIVHGHINKVPIDNRVLTLIIKDESLINFNLNQDDKINYYRLGYNLTMISEATRNLIKNIHIDSFSLNLEEISKYSYRKKFDLVLKELTKKIIAIKI